MPASAATMFAALSSRALSCTAATRTIMPSPWVVAMPRLLAVSPAGFFDRECFDRECFDRECFDYGTLRLIRELPQRYPPVSSGLLHDEQAVCCASDTLAALLAVGPSPRRTPRSAPP